MARVYFILLAILMVVAACQKSVVEEGRTAPLFEKMGEYSHPITTDSELAQQYFDQGLKLAYGFNHAEAVRSFKEAARLDPEAPMPQWGVALALGPNINKPMDDKDVPAAYSAVQKAMALSKNGSEVERALVAALSQRYAAEVVESRDSLDLAYADAMREVVKQFPEDLDAATLFAESLMDLIPWDYWLEDGQPKPETKEILATLESVLERYPDHPGANHYYIHAVEASNAPERGEPAADRLGDLVPDAGHLVHMPSHIYLRIGRYNDATEANVRAAASDESYIAQCNAQGFYPALYYPHNIHFLWFTSGIEGRSAMSIDASQRLVKNVSRERVQEWPSMETFLAIPLFTLARFQKWDDVLAQPKPPEGFKYETAMWHYTRGLAFAGKGQLAEAKAQYAVLDSLSKTETIAALEQPFFYGATLVSIANDILAGKVAGMEGEIDAQLKYLRTAVENQDGLPYMEPPYWYYPVRQTLGAALLAADKPAEAETVFREDLEKTPRNGWALHGLVESLKAQQKTKAAAAAKKRFEKAWEMADFTLAIEGY